MCWIKKVFDFLSVNEAAVDLYGYSKQEFLGMNIRDLWVDSANEAVENIVETKKDESFEITIIHKTKNDKIIHLEIQSNLVQFEGKEARVSILNNVTAHIEAEKKLEFSQKRFKSLVQEGSDLIMILDTGGNLEYVSPSSTSILGISSEEFKTNKFLFQGSPR